MYAGLFFLTGEVCVFDSLRTPLGGDANHPSLLVLWRVSIKQEKVGYVFSHKGAGV